MAESANLPMDRDEDDDEDLFVSALGSESKQASSIITKPNLTADSVARTIEEIDLKDEEADNISNEKPNDWHKGHGIENDRISSDEPKDWHQGPLDYNPIEENDEKTKATIPAPCVTVSHDSSNFKPTSSTCIPVTSTNETKVDPDRYINIEVGDPQKSGEGMSQFVYFVVSTTTNYPFFHKNSFKVNRRFSDFLGLRDKLAYKHLHSGYIVPPAPEKDAVGTAKVIISKDESGTSSEFLERRAASLERFLKRIVAHPHLLQDPDVREFLEFETDLPRAKNTSALSGAGVRRLINKIGDNVNKITFRMDESDPWFEEKQNQIDNLDQQLRKLHASVEALIHHRKELTMTTGAFAKSAAMLGNCEENTALSCALSQLAETEEKIEQLYAEQANNDFYYLSELLHDYTALIGVVKETFHQRVKVYQNWQHAKQMLTKKRDAKVKLELAHKTDRYPQANEEVLEWEAKVNRGREEFEQISKNIKKEVEFFELNRIKDFKMSIVKYMESLLNSQQQLIKYWEAFIPEAKAIY